MHNLVVQHISASDGKQVLAWRILIVLSFVTIEACATALVRKHAFSGSVAADGSIEISDGSVDSTPQALTSLVRSMKVDANGITRNAVDTRDKVWPNYAFTNDTERLKSLAGRRPHTNSSTVNTQAKGMSKASTHSQALPDDGGRGDLAEAIPNTMRQQQRLLVIRRTVATFAMHQSSIALNHTRVRESFITFFLLTSTSVLVGFCIALLFPDQGRGVVDHMISFKQSFHHGNDRHPKKSIRQKLPAENEFLNNFEIGEKLGEGAFGVVHVVFSRREGKKYAAKMIDVMGSDLDLIKEEVAILKLVQHASLTACCLHEYHDKCFYYLVMPIYDGGDLAGAVTDHIALQGLVPERLFARLFEQMTKGVAFVQSKWVVHRDIKPENFLLASSRLDDPRNRVVVADFGMSTVLDDGAFLEEICGTPIFMSPELFAGKYEFKVDVFALGLSAYVILTGAFAFNTEKEIETWATSSDPPPLPPSISPAAQEIIEKSLARDASERLGAKEVEKLAAKLRSRSLDEYTSTRAETINPSMLKDKYYKTLGIGGGEIQENKGDRRHRMICELIRAHEGKTMAKYAGESNISAEVLEARAFEIKKGRRNKKVSKFEFWPREDCLQNHVSGIDDAELNPLPEVSEVLPSDVELLEDVLARYSVDTIKWGLGKAKSTEDLAKECKSGVCFLTESEKMLERVVEIVALIVTNRNGEIIHQLPVAPKPSLGRVSQRKTALLQNNFTQPRLPAKKRQAWETVRETTDRVLDMLNMSKELIDLNFDVPMRVVKESSTSYPELTTVYKKHIVEVSIREDECDPEQLWEWGLPGSNKFATKTKNGVSNWGWLSQRDAENIGTLDEGEDGLAMRYAEVLPVKSKVISGDLIREMLRNANANIDGMSHQALEELAEQIRTGEVELIEEEQDDGTRSLKRKVTATMLRLAHQEGSILLEVAKSTDGGASWKDTTWLPATKQHTFENPFYVARRLITSRFMVAEGRWQIDKDEGGSVSEEKESDKLPGLPTIYTKNIVVARLC